MSSKRKAEATDADLTEFEDTCCPYDNTAPRTRLQAGLLTKKQKTQEPGATPEETEDDTDADISMVPAAKLRACDAQHRAQVKRLKDELTDVRKKLKETKKAAVTAARAAATKLAKIKKEAAKKPKVVKQPQEAAAWPRQDPVQVQLIATLQERSATL